MEAYAVTAPPPFTLHDLAARVSARARASGEESYTRKLLDKGVAHCAKKLGEEAVELALASVIESRERLIDETADLLYHLLVVLKARDIKLSEVETVLGARASQTGLQEKSSRKGG
jgi:phosphoribosyl-ATP pyrophosphohydrolase